MTFEEMCKARDPEYAETMPQGDFSAAVRYDKAATDPNAPYGIRLVRDSALLWLTIRALRNQRQPYYFPSAKES